MKKEFSVIITVTALVTATTETEAEKKAAKLSDLLNTAIATTRQLAEASCEAEVTDIEETN